MMLDVIKWLKKLKDAISQMSDLIYSHSGRHKPGGADTLFPADYNIEPNSDNVYDIGSNNNSWRRIHGYVHRLKPTSPPTSPLEGDLIYDGNEKVLKYYDGTGWRVFQVKEILVGPTSERPDPGVAYRLYISTDEEIIYLDNGTEWRPLGAVYK